MKTLTSSRGWKRSAWLEVVLRNGRCGGRRGEELDQRHGAVRLFCPGMNTARIHGYALLDFRGAGPFRRDLVAGRLLELREQFEIRIPDAAEASSLISAAWAVADSSKLAPS